MDRKSIPHKLLKLKALEKSAREVGSIPEADSAAEKIIHLQTTALATRRSQPNITERTVKALRPPATGDHAVFDQDPPGFAVRITSNGVVSFFLDYTCHGRRRRYTIGRHPEWSVLAAREEARKLRVEAQKGNDPQEKRMAEREEGLVRDLAAEYLGEWARPRKRPSTLRNDEAMLNTIILPKLGRHRVTAVTQPDIIRLHNSLKDRPYRGNRLLSLLSHMFAKAVEWKWRPDNPCRGVQRFHEDKREAWMSVEQIERLERALDGYADQDAADAIRLLLFTGSRKAEVLNATWPELDLERGQWTKPSHHTKQKKIEHVPLNELALAVLKRRAKHKNGPFVFPGRDAQHPRAALTRPWAQVLRAAGLVERYEIPGKRRKVVVRYRLLFRLHDLRHTFCSHLVSGGQSLQIVGKLVGHTREATTARYAHLANAALQQATDQFAGIVNGKTTITTKKRARAASA